MATKQKSTFDVLNEIDVSKYVKQKGQFTYLSWAWAVRELLKVAPDATWEVHEYNSSIGESGEFITAPFMQTTLGVFVKVTLTVGGIPRTQVHPVLDNRNKPIPNPNAFEINTSIQRCLAKAIALHGLGLYIFAGEDLPVVKLLSEEQKEELLKLAKSIDFKTHKSVQAKIKQEAINESNYDAAVNKLEQMVKYIKENS
jgi:hypothetical protein